MAGSLTVYIALYRNPTLSERHIADLCYVLRASSLKSASLKSSYSRNKLAENRASSHANYVRTKTSNLFHAKPRSRKGTFFALSRLRVRQSLLTYRLTNKIRDGPRRKPCKFTPVSCKSLLDIPMLLAMPRSAFRTVTDVRNSFCKNIPTLQGSLSPRKRGMIRLKAS
jgi:hypothetical protein